MPCSSQRYAKRSHSMLAINQNKLLKGESENANIPVIESMKLVEKEGSIVYIFVKRTECVCQRHFFEVDTSVTLVSYTARLLYSLLFCKKKALKIQSWYILYESVIVNQMVTYFWNCLIVLFMYVYRIRSSCRVNCAIVHIGVRLIRASIRYVIFVSLGCELRITKSYFSLTVCM